ncbi:MAG: branched-chain amino acid ABC transporter permease [Chloroflexi bacterium]|nr:branched-chain amino acid ABC transporter permease [Chloroflexota bacterium]
MSLDLYAAAFGFGLVTASILAIAAVGFTMQFGITNILNLAYGDLMTASAFVAYVANSFGVSIWIAILIGGLFGAVASVALNRIVYTPFLRRGTSPFGMVIVSLAVGLAIQNTLLGIGGPTAFSYQMDPGPTLRLGSIVLTVSQVVVMVIAVLAMAALAILLTRTRLGKAMRASAANAPLARSCGIRTDRVTDIVWAISGALCGIAGVVLVINTASFTAVTGSTFLVVVIAVAVLGGVGQPNGAMIGALIVGLATEIGAVIITPSYKDVIAFLILVVVLLLRPQGILSLVRSNA